MKAAAPSPAWPEAGYLDGGLTARSANRRRDRGDAMIERREIGHVLVVGRPIQLRTS
jgi:hypothetical protein